MDITGFEKIAKYLAVPLVLVGFALMLVFGIHDKLIASGLLTQVSAGDSSEIIKLMLRYGFQLGLCVTVLGFGLAAWSKYMDKVQVQQVNIDLLAEKVALKVAALQVPSEPGREEAKKAVIEAVTALPKADAPAKSINEALQELEQGNTAKAQAIFAEVLRSKEAEGRQANKEAAAAARHLGALAFMNDTKAALAAYQKAVQLDPDNADGWNQLGHLLRRTGELAKAEEAYRKVLALGEAHQDKEEQALALGNLGIVHWTRGELDKAEEMYKKSLEISEALGLKEVTASQYGNLGTVHEKRSELDKAEQMYMRSFELHEAVDSKEGMATCCTNLGSVYALRGKLDKSEQMFMKALEISEALGLKEATAALYGNLGNVYDIRGDLDKAEDMQRKALALHKALDSREGMARDYANIGTLYEGRGNLDQVEVFWNKSLHLLQEMGHPKAKEVQQWLDKLANPR